MVNRTNKKGVLTHKKTIHQQKRKDSIEICDVYEIASCIRVSSDG